MGNREDLLAAAKRCLLEKGYRATTARDIAAASGVSLAAIGYHFGSKEQLMNQAVYDAIGEWSEGFQQALAEAPAQTSALDRAQTLWAHMIESFEGSRSLWAAQFELIPELERQPVLRAFFAAIQPEAHLGLGEIFYGERDSDGPVDKDTLTRVGKLYHAILIGVMAQHLIDPTTASTAQDLATALRTVAAGVLPQDEGPNEEGEPTEVDSP